jgi:nucleotide-binding universal stress UspA family protein
MKEKKMKIIIATDGSDFSRNAIAKFCRSTVDPEKLKVKIVSVYEELAALAAEPFAIPAEYYTQFNAEAQARAEKFASDAAKQIRKCFPDADIDIETESIMGTPGKSIVQAARDWNADLIVVGSHGYGFWSSALLGSVSDSVIHHAPCSVLVVRKPESFNGKN